jgi:hypothetical protein
MAATKHDDHKLARTFMQFLDLVVDDQMTGDSYAFRVLANAFSTSVAASIMQAADVRRAQRGLILPKLE